MYPSVTDLIRTNHPIVNKKIFGNMPRSSHEIELMWCLYHAWPSSAPRLEKTQAATRRIQFRKKPHILPPRRAFETTVDYYEAAMPLYMAKMRFISFNRVDYYFRSVQSALKTILPPRLF